MDASVSMEGGVFHKDGKPLFFISGDYPYYRDLPADWGVKLDQIKAIGIDTVSCYFPWRHHAIELPSGEIRYDFDGTTYPSRNVIGFIDLVRQKGMFLIAKPGPFIHAETTYGGLPDFVCPKNNKAIVPSRNAWGHVNKWPFMFGKPLPSPLETPYVGLVLDYMGQLGKHVFQKACYPDGPIIAVQILNEGIYSQGNISLDNFEYSSIAKKMFNEFLAKKYNDDIGLFNKCHATKAKGFGDVAIPRPPGVRKIEHLQGLKIAMDWGEFTTTYYNAIMARYLEGIYHGAGEGARSLPVMINTNPPSNFKQGADTFLTRMVPERMLANYGYTNWIGVVPYRDDSWYRYALMIKRYKGVNLEENWGFSDYYDPIYEHGHVSYYQTLLAIALGTTGFNVYTAAKTRAWPPELDQHTSPYPRSAPITEAGERTDKCDLIELFTSLFSPRGKFGGTIVGARSPSVVHYGVYTPYAALHSWIGNDTGTWKKVDLATPPSVAEHGLSSFHLAMEARGFDYTPINLEDDKSRTAILKPGNVLVLVSSDFLSRDVQGYLGTFIEAGGHLVLAGTVPRFDENFDACTLLRDTIDERPVAEARDVVDDLQRRFSLHVHGARGKHGKVVLIDGNPFARVPDKNDRKFHHILKLLKAIIPFNFLKQIPAANAEGELGSKLAWMRGKYTQHAAAFSSPVVEMLADLLGFRPYVRYRDNLVQTEPVQLARPGQHGAVLSLPTRKYKVLARRYPGGQAPDQGVDFVFVFSRTDDAIKASFSILDHPSQGREIDVEMDLPPRSAHAIVLQGGQVEAFLLNGRVTFNGAASKIELKAGNEVIATGSVADVLGMKETPGEYRFRVAYPGTEPVHVTINSKRFGPFQNAGT